MLPNVDKILDDVSSTSLLDSQSFIAYLSCNYRTIMTHSGCSNKLVYHASFKYTYPEPPYSSFATILKALDMLRPYPSCDVTSIYKRIGPTLLCGPNIVQNACLSIRVRLSIRPIYEFLLLHHILTPSILIHLANWFRQALVCVFAKRGHLWCLHRE